MDLSLKLRDAVSEPLTWEGRAPAETRGNSRVLKLAWPDLSSEYFVRIQRYNFGSTYQAPYLDRAAGGGAGGAEVHGISRTLK